MLGEANEAEVNDPHVLLFLDFGPVPPGTEGTPGSGWERLLEFARRALMAF